jgi:four helix bundle protein
MMRDFRKIEAWQLADDLAVAVYEATMAFPKEEVYGITSQIRRAVTSVAANIVEGASRESAKDYAHFLQIARGSLAETQYFLHLARRLAYLDQELATELEQAARRVFGCLHGLIQAVRGASADRDL